MKRFRDAGQPICETKGIMQSIGKIILTFLSLSFSGHYNPPPPPSSFFYIFTFKGYKEFQPYIDARDRERNGQGSTEQTKEALAACVDTLKARTRRYAKVQCYLFSFFVMSYLTILFPPPPVNRRN